MPAPSITGLVSDFSNQPVANAVVELTENPLFSNVSGRKIATVRTTPNGQYQFSEIDDQCVFLTCRVSADTPTIFTRSLWSQKGSLCVANIGGKPVLTGTVIIDGLPLAGRKLYLSDTLDINHASFRQETMTDADGNFTFSGVFGGVYSVMHEGLDNRLHRLGTIEMAPRDIFNVNLNIETVTVILPDQPNISNAILDYTLDAPNNLNQIRASLIEGAVLQFLNVIPGSYVLRVKLDNGVWLQQNIEVEKGPAEQMIQPDLI
ncbi:MAG: carboxypeptidase-like regulatory domain-containing protein, partial [Planctomycetota bacterium]